MRVVVLSQWFPPEGAWIPADIANDLANKGHDVTVLTGFPNYPGGKIYEGWVQRAWMDSHHEAYRIRRVALFPSHDSSVLHRAANYLSFGLTATIFGWGILRRADVVYVYHPPLTAAFGPWLSRMLGGPPYVLHIQDLWPDSVISSDMLLGWKGRFFERTVSAACRALYRRSSGVLCIAPTMSKLLQERGVRANDVHVVPNWADENVFFPIQQPGDETRIEFGFNDVFTVMYAGNMGPMQDLTTAIQAAALVRDLPDFRLVLVGDGLARQSLHALATKIGATNVQFIDPRPLTEMNALVQAATVQLVSLRDLDFFRGTIPSKLGAVMASGLPVICAVNGDASQVVREADAGWTCPAEDVHALARAFRQAHASPPEVHCQRGSNARTYYERHLAKFIATKKINSILRAAAARAER